MATAGGRGVWGICDVISAGGGGGAAGRVGAGGAGATGGSGGAMGGSGGATGGSGGAGGARSCAAPSNASDAALCLKFAPEAMTFLNERDLDGRGVLVVGVYDTSAPDAPDGGVGTPPLACRVLPKQAANGGTAELAVTALPVVRFDNLPAGTVYVQTWFFDNPAMLSSKTLGWGVWFGGLDFSGGLEGSRAIAPIALSAGHAKSVTQALTAVRRLRVDLSLASGTTPLGAGGAPAHYACAADAGTP